MIIHSNDHHFSPSFHLAESMSGASCTNDKGTDDKKSTNGNSDEAKSSRLQLFLYVTLPPDKNVTTAHVHQILGIGNHSAETNAKTIANQ